MFKSQTFQAGPRHRSQLPLRQFQQDLVVDLKQISVDGLIHLILRNHGEGNKEKQDQVLKRISKEIFFFIETVDRVDMLDLNAIELKARWVLRKDTICFSNLTS